MPLALAAYLHPFVLLHLEREVGRVAVAAVEPARPAAEVAAKAVAAEKGREAGEAVAVKAGGESRISLRRKPPREEGPSVGQRLLAEGEWRAAEGWFRRALAGMPEWRDGWAGLASALSAQGRGEAASEAWRRLRALAPRDRRATAGLALSGAPEVAERRLLTLLREEREPWLLAALGRLRAESGRRAAALAIYREALRASPADERLRRAVRLLSDVEDTRTGEGGAS